MPQGRSGEAETSAWCPNCGRFVGPRQVCEHCGAPVPQRVSLRAARYGAQVLAILGLFLLWVAAREADAPVVRIADVHSGMNWAYVKMAGTVTDGPSYDEQSGALSFWFDDGSGEAMVTAYRAQSQVLREAGNVPSIGDRVEVEGTLRVREGFCALTVNIPERLEVERPKASDLAIREVTTGLLLQKVRVRGQVLDRRDPYPGLTVLTLRDRTGQIDVTYTSDLVQLGGLPLEVVVGDFVQVRGAVTQYGQAPQIALEAADALEPLPGGVEVGAHRAIGEVRVADVGDRVHIQGVVTEVRSITGGRVCLVDDGTGTISLLLWQDMLEQIENRDDLSEGTWLSALGVVAAYRGALELVPELALDVRISTAASAVGVEPPPAQVSPSATPEPTATHLPSLSALPTSTASLEPLVTPTASAELSVTPTASVGPSVTVTASLEASVTPTASLEPSATATVLPSPSPTSTPSVAPTATALPTAAALPDMPTLSTGQVSAAFLGQEVRVAGLIVEARALSIGVQLLIDDGSGRIMVWMPLEIYEQLADPGGWVLGSTVRVEGLVKEYQEQIEIVPLAAEDMGVVTRAAPPANVASIGDLTASRVGERVTVRGQIVEVKAFSKGMQYVIDDGSGQITLLLWQNVHDVVPSREELTAGAVVSATGILSEYQGALEVVPDVGGDVVVER